MNSLRTHHVAVVCSDHGRSKRYFTEVLGPAVVREVYRADRCSWKLDQRLADGTQVKLLGFPTSPKRPSSPEACGLRYLAFEVEDVGAAVRHLEGMGWRSSPCGWTNTPGSGSPSYPTRTGCRSNCTSGDGRRRTSVPAGVEKVVAHVG